MTYRLTCTASLPLILASCVTMCVCRTNPCIFRGPTHVQPHPAPPTLHPLIPPSTYHPIRVHTAHHTDVSPHTPTRHPFTLTARSRSSVEGLTMVLRMFHRALRAQGAGMLSHKQR